MLLYAVNTCEHPEGNDRKRGQSVGLLYGLCDRSEGVQNARKMAA